MYIKIYNGSDELGSLYDLTDIEEMLSILIGQPEWKGQLKLTAEYSESGFQIDPAEKDS